MQASFLKDFDNLYKDCQGLSKKMLVQMFIKCLFSPLYGFDLSSNNMVYETDFNPEVKKKKINTLSKLFAKRKSFN